MNIRAVAFLILLCFTIGLIIGASKKTARPPCPEVVVTVHDTIIQVQRDTIEIPVKQVKYYTKVDTVRIRDTVAEWKLDCVTFPLLLSDSSIIAVNGCSALGIPRDLELDAQWIDKRERTRTILKVDTIRIAPKRMGFTLGPSAGVGIDINNISKPAYFIGATLTYGWRF